MKQIVESGDDDDDELRFSNGSMSSCLFPMLTSNDCPRKSLSYDKLHQRPLRLAVLKLDGSSFEIEVAKSGKVWEVKKAVESAFRHLPKDGPNKVSWEHVWGQFCLCHEGQKLLTDSDYLSLFNIKDGDQLQFVHHASSTYDLAQIQSGREDLDSDDERPSVSRKKKSEKDVGGHNQIAFIEDNQDDNTTFYDDDFSRSRHRLTNFFRYFFPYQKLPSSPTSHAELEDDNSSTSPRQSFSGNRLEYRKETCKGK